MRKVIQKISAITGVLLLCFGPAVSAFANGISSTNAYAWGENIGWLNFADGGTTIGATDLSGYAWGENVGWVSLNCSNTSSCGTVSYKVSRETPSATTVPLTGYAWGENVGWISFNCDNTSSCGTVNYRVTIDGVSGDFSGVAWGENVGWIVFNCTQTSSCGAVNYKVSTSDGAIPGFVESGGGGAPAEPPGQTPPPASSTPVPSTPAPTPVVSGTPVPGETPPPVAPTESPPPAMPETPPPTYTPPGEGGGIGGAIDSVAGFVDRISKAVFGDAVPPLITITADVATAAAAVPVAVAVAATIAQNEAAAVTYHTFVIFGLRRKSKVWGTVYDSQTKHPVPFAKLQLLDAAGHVLETRFADRDGRYGFLTSPSSLQQETLKVSIVASKDGYQFPSRKVSLGVDFVVYDHVYFGDVLELRRQDTYLSYNIPMDPVGVQAHRLSSALGLGLAGTITDKLLNLGFILGLFVLPLNYVWHPDTQNLVLLLLFLLINGIRTFVVYRPYGVIKDATTGKELPFSLVTLNDMAGKRLAFAVSDERGRYFLPAERGAEYQLMVYTPANIVPQRTKNLHIAPHSYTSRRAWVTINISL